MSMSMFHVHVLIYIYICCAQVVTVSDEEMREATRALYRAGVVAEVSGAAAVAAVIAGKLGDVRGAHPCRTHGPPGVGFGRKGAVVVVVVV